MTIVIEPAPLRVDDRGCCRTSMVAAPNIGAAKKTY
jgi:hypothetical protein